MRFQPLIVVALLCLSLQFSLNVVSASTNGVPSFALQAGASGDATSTGNVGAQASIRTHIEKVTSPDYDYSFWVGNNLADGGFIQFGYTLMKPGQYCSHYAPTRQSSGCQETAVASGDARWFWQYWPKITVTDYYYGLGPEHSAGNDGSWHTYGLSPNDRGGWSFVLDGQTVDRLDVSPGPSKDPAYVVAEVVTSSPSAGRSFGPVEFSNLSYYDMSIWHPVASLKILSGCGLSNGCIIPYGVTILGPNHILVATKSRV